MEHIPIRIRNDGHYRISQFDLADNGYEALYRDLTGHRAARRTAAADDVSAADRVVAPSVGDAAHRT